MWKGTRHSVWAIGVMASVWVVALASAAVAPIAYEFTLIADTTGPFSGFGSSVSINNAGTVAFNAGPDAGGEGIFTGPDIIDEGDRPRRCAVRQHHRQSRFPALDRRQSDSSAMASTTWAKLRSGRD